MTTVGTKDKDYRVEFERREKIACDVAPDGKLSNCTAEASKWARANPADEGQGKISEASKTKVPAKEAAQMVKQLKDSDDFREQQKDFVNSVAARADGEKPVRYDKVAPAGTTSEQMELGQRGKPIKPIQQDLQDRGFYKGKLDGKAGPLTMAARDAAQLTDLAKKGDDEGIAKLMANKSNAEMDRIRDSMSAAGETPAGLKRGPDGKYQLSKDEDLNDSLNDSLKGKQVENREAAATDARVEDLADKVLQARVDPNARALGLKNGLRGKDAIGDAWNGTDEKGMSDAIRNASDGQLRRLNSRLKAGIKDEDGNVVQFNNGLEGLIKKEINNGWGSEPLDKLLLERVKSALGN